ncbi:MAG TPA: hypothetical protein VKU01_19415 [Bryobacteraceae bacterium]|nr:hypothetical protein [Bryobacteraceae bacterium]
MILSISLGPNGVGFWGACSYLAFQDGSRLGTYRQPGRAVVFRFENPSNLRVRRHELIASTGNGD